MRAARRAGIETGGLCPKSWLTELGPQPDLLQSFSLKEHSSTKYPPRTHANVEAGDATLIIAKEMDTGSKLTADLCRALDKPMLHLTRGEMVSGQNGTLDAALDWLGREAPAVLNVAGNRESKSPGIETEAEAFLFLLFSAAQVK